MSNHSPGFCKNFQYALLCRFLIYLPAGRGYNQLYKIRCFPALQHPGCCRQILQTSVGTGADKDLINGNALQLTDISDFVHLGRTCHNRNKILCPVGHGLKIRSVLVAL